MKIRAKMYRIFRFAASSAIGTQNEVMPLGLTVRKSHKQVVPLASLHNAINKLKRKNILMRGLVGVKQP